MTSEAQLCLHPFLDRNATELLEAKRLGPREVGVGELGEGASAPEGKRLIQERSRRRRLTGGGALLRVADQLLEPEGVELIGLERQQVSGCHRVRIVAAVPSDDRCGSRVVRSRDT